MRSDITTLKTSPEGPGRPHHEKQDGASKVAFKPIENFNGSDQPC
jgi:hypothetical protein